ncbi:hypothetical protein LTR85_000176 [Meristemomyces frigidus]|nr:hypothetical protein LTR85_000176 [Meristemomyces frigidus]
MATAAHTAEDANGCVSSMPTSQVKQPPPDSREVFPFVDLPPELRKRIYEAALICSTEASPLFIQPRTLRTEGHRQLLQLSRQARGECLPIYYADTSFINGGSADGYPPLNARSWLGAIGSEAVTHLRMSTLNGTCNCQLYEHLRLRLVGSSYSGAPRQTIMDAGTLATRWLRFSCGIYGWNFQCAGSEWVTEGMELAEYLSETWLLGIKVEVEEGFERRASILGGGRLELRDDNR